MGTAASHSVFLRGDDADDVGGRIFSVIGFMSFQTACS